MANAYNIPAPTQNETDDAKRTRILAEYNHTHAPGGGHHITLAPLQDAVGANCGECGRTITTGAPWQHSLQCSLYTPHPNSIAGQ